MIVRLCLVFLLMGSAPLSVAQQAGCGMHAEQQDASQAADGHAHHVMDGMSSHDNVGGDDPGHACGDCDLACLAACAGTVAADLTRAFPGLQRHTPQQQDVSAARRQAHRLDLLRPPTSRIS